MTEQASYTEEELKEVSIAMMTVAFGVVFSDFGIFQVKKEMEAMFLSLAQAAHDEKFKDNSLIQSLLNNKIQASKEWNVEPGVVDKMLAQIKVASDIIDSKSPPEEALQLKNFLYEVAERVANASGEGFLGLGKKVSKKEADFLGKLKTVLALSS